MRWFLVLTSLGLVVCLTGVFLLMRPDAEGTRPPFFPATEDQVLLREVPGEGPAPKFGGTPIYDACAMITIDSLTSLGVELNHDVVVMHDYLDGDVPPEAAVSQAGLDSASRCSYQLSNGNRLHVEVHQTPYNSAEDLEFSIGRAERQGARIRSEDGLSIARMDDKDAMEIRLWRTGLLVAVVLGTKQPGLFDEQTFATKLESVVKAALLRDPTAPMRHVYTSLFDRVKHPCEVASAEVFMKAFPSRSAAAVRTQFHPRPSRTLMERHPDHALQGGMLCLRHNIVAEGTVNKAEYRELDLKLNVWDNPQAATDLNTYSCDPADRHPFGPPVAVSPSVGTGQTCMGDLQIDWVLNFLVDNVNVSLQGGSPVNGPTASRRRDELLPAARAIAAAGTSR